MSDQILATRLKSKSPEFLANAEKMQAQVKDLKEQIGQSALGGNERSRSRHTQRGKLLPRDRIERLIDTGSAFLEFSQLAACLLYTSPSPRDRQKSRMPSSA